MKLTWGALVVSMVFILISSGCKEQPGVDSEAGMISSRNFAVSEDGVSVYYQVHGQGEITLVFVHGWCGDHSYWNSQLPSFKVYYNIVTIDLGGHGRSGSNRQDWTIEAFGKDVVAVVEKLDLSKVVLIGHSLGGPVILEAARSLSGRVIGLIGVDSLSDIYLESLSPEEINIFLSGFRSDFIKEIQRYALENFFRFSSEEDLKKKIILDMTSMSPDVAIGSLESLLQYDGRAALGEIKIPIRSINADRPIVPFKVIRGHTDNFSLKFMVNEGHFVMMENPQVFNRNLADFLGEIILESYQEK